MSTNNNPTNDQQPLEAFLELAQQHRCPDDQVCNLTRAGVILQPPTPPGPEDGLPNGFMEALRRVYGDAKPRSAQPPAKPSQSPKPGHYGPTEALAAGGKCTSPWRSNLNAAKRRKSPKGLAVVEFRRISKDFEGFDDSTRKANYEHNSK